MADRSRHVAGFVAVTSLLAAASCQHAGVPHTAQVAPVKCLTGSGIDVAAPEAIPASALPADGPDAIHPCKTKTPEWDAATKAATTLGAHVSALADDGDPRPLQAELERILATPCFALSAGDPHDDSSFDSAVSLKAWWDGGGGVWVDHYLALDDSPQSAVPPTRRRSLLSTSPAAKHSPLAPLLCPPADARLTDATGCGRETMGWVKRATASFVHRAGHARLGSREATPERCVEEALAKDVAANQRYATYRECLETVVLRHDALPVGRFKAPSDGWFVIAGGRRQCVDLFAYDLATGAAHRISDCHVRSATPRPTPITTASGRVPLPLLREAVWMIMLAQVVEHNVLPEVVTFEVPPAIVIQRVGSWGRGGTGGFGCGTQSPRAWSWMRSKGGALVGQASGVLQWPSGCGDADGHAVELLEIAEDGFEAGCAPVGPPGRLPWSAPGPAIEHDHAAVLDDPALDAVRAELGTLAARGPGPCTK